MLTGWYTNKTIQIFSRLGMCKTKYDNGSYLKLFGMTEISYK